MGRRRAVGGYLHLPLSVLAGGKGKYDYPVGELFHQHLEQINGNRRIYVLRTSLPLPPGSN